MSTFYNKLSPSTRLLIQSLFAVLGSVLSGVATAAYQSYTQAGHLDLQALVNVSLLTFALLFGKAMHDWIPAHAQQLIQAGKDNEARLLDALQRAQAVRSPQNLPAVAPVLVQAPASPITADHIQSIAAQLAVNLINIASNNAQQAKAAQTPPAPPVAPPAPPVPAPYVDPLRNSAVLPAYTPPVADQTTQSVPAQVPFTL